MNPYQTLLATSALSVAFLLGGCATPGGTGAGSAPPYADVLRYPDRLKPAAEGDDALIWVDPSFDFAKYDKFLIENIRIHLADDAAYKAVDPTELKTLTDYLYNAIVKALKPNYKVVSKPGPGVLRVRIVITNLVPTKPEYSVVALVVPYATVVDLASGPASGGPVGSTSYLGRTGIAGSLIDALTNQVVAEYADNEVGRKYVVDTREGVTKAVTTGVTDYVAAYSTWAYAKQAFDGWAADFRKWLDGVHGR
jgi:hypothetical protein